jgi:hypothetical protein
LLEVSQIARASLQTSAIRIILLQLFKCFEHSNKNKNSMVFEKSEKFNQKVIPQLISDLCDLPNSIQANQFSEGFSLTLL